MKFVEATDQSTAGLKSQVESGQVTWDMMPSISDFGFDADASYLEPIDYTHINTSEIIPGLFSKYRVATITSSAVIAYRTDKFSGKVPQSWADFWDVNKFPGKRGMYDSSTGGIFEAALLADGVSPKALYPIDINRALKKLDEIKSNLVFWDSGATSQELIESGEVTMSLMWNGRAWAAGHTDNKPIAIQWNGQLLNADFWVVPKGAPDKDAAMNFIAWTTCSENNAALSKYITYGPINSKATPDPTNAPDLPTSNINDTSLWLNFQWLKDNATQLDAAYNAWKTK